MIAKLKSYLCATERRTSYNQGFCISLDFKRQIDIRICNFSSFRVTVTKQPNISDWHNSFGLADGERGLQQWTSEECASDWCGGINYTKLLLIIVFFFVTIDAQYIHVYAHAAVNDHTKIDPSF